MKVLESEENILIGEIINGKSGFRKLFELLFSPLCAFGCKYVNDTLLIEDFVQESFVSFWNKRHDFNSLAAIKSYLYTSVKNSCLNYIKHQAVRRKNEGTLIHTIETDHYYQNHIIEEEVFNLLYEEIKNLSGSAQQVMLLALNGLKNPEIASELGVSINTVKSIKKNAYSKLRKKLSFPIQSKLYAILF